MAVTCLLREDADGAVAALIDPARDAAAVRAIATLGRPALIAAALLASADGTAENATTTQCAGVFLLIRAVMDVRLVTTGRGASPILAALALRWGGAPAVIDGRLDPGLPLLAGYDTAPTPDEVAAQLMKHDLDRLRSDVVRTLTGQRLAHPEFAEISLEGPASESGPLRAALESLAEGGVGDAHADRAIAMMSIAVLRHWARWLRRFSDSSTPFLLEEMIRRPGRVFIDARGIAVELAQRPLDLVLEMAGYLGEIDAVPWLGGRRVRFLEQRTS
jgi:hypothetical protein